MKAVLLANLKSGAAYWVAGLIGAVLTDPLGVASPLWPAAGVAVVATLVYGYRVLPGIAVGEFLIAAYPPLIVYLPGGVPVPAAVGFAVAYVAQAFVAVALLRRISGWPSALIRGKDVLVFVAAIGPLGAAIAATIAAAAINRFADPSIPDLPYVWWNFFVGGTLGAVLVAPLLLIATGEPRELWRSRIRSMLLPFALTVVALVALLVATAQIERSHMSLQFDRRALAVSKAIEHTIDQYLDVVVASGSYVRTLPGEVDAEQFSSFARERLRRFSGIAALGWDPLVTAAARAAFERRMREEGFDGFTITEQGNGGKLVAAAARQQYVPVQYIEPVAGNRDAVGYDIYSDALRRKALDAARASRSLTTTAPIRLVQDNTPQAGVLVAEPVFGRAGANTDVDADTLLGYVVGVMRTEAVLNAALVNVDTLGIDLSLDDVTDAPSTTPLGSNCMTGTADDCSGNSLIRTMDPQKFVRLSTIDVGGRQWRLTLTSSVGYFAANRPLSAWLAPGVAVLISIAVASFLLVVTGSTYIDKMRSRELAIKNRELERFTYSVSHDLKSPLITIRGYVGCLVDDIEDGNTEQAISDIRRIDDAATNMMQTLDGLLALSRAGRLIAPADGIDMRAVVREAADLLAGLVDSLGATIEISDRLPVLTGDRLRLREVVQNLLENALKFMGDQPQPRVVVDAIETTHEWQFSVSDNGIGVEAGHVEQVFDLFERLDSGTEGSGIGLALCRRIIELHGGRIWLQSDGPGRGTTVSFTLPRR